LKKSSNDSAKKTMRPCNLKGKKKEKNRCTNWGKKKKDLISERTFHWEKKGWSRKIRKRNSRRLEKPWKIPGLGKLTKKNFLKGKTKKKRTILVKQHRVKSTE